jgi:hypothetical protein
MRARWSMKGKRAQTGFLQRGNVICASCSKGSLSISIFLFPEGCIRDTGRKVVLGSHWGHCMSEGKADNAGGNIPNYLS